MTITATLKNAYQTRDISVKTGDMEKSIAIASKPDGYGSSVNGGELLFLALATCFCNDLYREAAKRSMILDAVEVTISGEFGGEGEPARQISYHAQVKAENHTEAEIADLIQFTDKVAEIHNTLRQGIAVTLKP